MNGFTGRARLCLATVAMGTALGFAGTSAGQAAERPPTTGAGVPIGQMSVQMYNWSRYLTGSTVQQQTRLREIFDFLRARGVRTIEPWTPNGFFGMTFPEFKELADSYGLHIVGRHSATISESGTSFETELTNSATLDQEFIGSGNVNPGGGPGFGTYANTLQVAASLNRLGKRSVEAGLGKLYTHNHQSEFQTQYEVNGVLKSAWEIVMDNTDPRWVAAEIDVGWAADGGADTVAQLNRYTDRVVMFHVKDGTNVNKPGNFTLTAIGTGEIDYTPIFAAAKNRVKYYHYELDPPSATFDTFTPAAVSLDNMRSDPAPTLYANVPRFTAGQPAGTGQEGAPKTVTVENTGDAPLTINAVAVQATAPDTLAAQDFRIVSQDCSGKTLAPGSAPKPATDTTPAQPRVDGQKCTVQVAHAPKRALTHSLARLQFTSNSDASTNRWMLSAKSGPSVSTTTPAGGEVPGILSLTLNNTLGATSFGTLLPGTARDYLATIGASVTSTTGDAALTVADPSTTDTGFLANGTFKLASPVQVGATNAAAPSLVHQPLTAPVSLLSWAAPSTNDAVTIGFKQPITATETLRAGVYAKALTFTLSTTTP